MAAVTDLYDLCKEYLDACATALVASPAGAATRTYVSPGVPAWDCADQLTVHAGGPVVGDTLPLSPSFHAGHRIEETGHVNVIAMTATILRCIPVISQYEGQVAVAPDALLIDNAAKNTLGDLWAIWNYLATKKRSEELFPPKSREMFLDPAVSLATSGGIGGWQIQVRVVLGGYRTGS